MTINLAENDEGATGRDNGGPAFPISGWPEAANEHPGMSLRDYFAAQAMQGYLAAGGTIDIARGPLFIERAEVCYAIADAMLKARM